MASDNQEVAAENPINHRTYGSNWDSNAHGSWSRVIFLRILASFVPSGQGVAIRSFKVGSPFERRAHGDGGKRICGGDEVAVMALGGQNEGPVDVS